MENCDGKVINMKCLGCQFLPLCLEEKVFSKELDGDKEKLILNSCPKTEKGDGHIACCCCD